MIWRGKAGDSLFRIMSIISISNPFILVKRFFHLTAEYIAGVMCKMKQTYQKLKNWYRGKQIPYTLQELMDLQRDRLDEPRIKHLPDRFDPPLIARIINSIGRFWLKHWTVLLPVIISVLGIIVALFIYFNSKP